MAGSSKELSQIEVPDGTSLLTDSGPAASVPVESLPPESSLVRVVRATVRTVAEVLFTVGVLLGALAFYLMVWTNHQTANAQSDLMDEFREKSRAAPATEQPGQARTADLHVLHIPALGADWAWVVSEGVELEELNRGPGHFPTTAAPGQVGNYAVAGHRATHGEPFADLDTLTRGDKIYVETTQRWFTYQVTWTRIVAPTAVEVLEPVAGRPGEKATAHTMTLITCHPRWGSSERLVVGAELVEDRDVAAGPPPALGHGSKES